MRPRGHYISFPLAVAMIVVALAIVCGAPTPTPTSISAPVTTATPTLEGEILALKQAGLPIGEVVVLTAETDPNDLLGRPGQYIAKGYWVDTRLPTQETLDMDAGGTIEIFGNEEDLATRKAYIEILAKSSLFVQYIYAEGLVLLRLPNAFTPKQATEYEKALRGIKSDFPEEPKPEPTATPPNVEPLVIGEPEWFGYGTGWIAVAVPVTNPNQDAWVPVTSYSLVVFGDGDQILSVEENASHFPPNSLTWVVNTTIDAGDPALVRRIEFTINPKFSVKPYPAPPISITQHNLRSRTFGPEILGIVKNEGEVEVDQVRINGLFRDAAGKLLGVAQGFSSQLLPGTTVPFRASISSAADISGLSYDIAAIPEGIMALFE